MPEITSLLKEKRIFYPPQEGREKAHISSVYKYKQIYKYSLEDPDGFWSEIAKNFITWFKYWDRTYYWDFTKPEIKFFEGGKLNACYNCIDRHLKNPCIKNKAAIIWQNEIGEVKVYTYQMLYNEVCKFANILKKLDVKKGDRVVIYMPMIPETIITMLACARIGAIHSVVFGGFSASALKTRILDVGAKILITADGTYRNGKKISFFKNAQIALENCECIKHCVIINHFKEPIKLPKNKKYLLLEDLLKNLKIYKDCKCESMDAEDILFVLYTSGSTGKPKGVIHTTGGYMVYSAYTTYLIFDLKPEDIFWCTADIGWITGHTYNVYGPLSLGATVFMYEGVPFYPHPGIWWELIDKYKITIFYTAPTVIRALMKEGSKWPEKYELSSLRILGSVGEPINSEAWLWYYENIGKGRCPIVDTWWQTETGGALISPLPYATVQKPSSATFPLPGIKAVVLRSDGTEANVNEGGYLCIKTAWPAIIRGIWGNPKKFKETYFERFPGYYYSEDGARVDEDGYFWIMGRLDDVINVSGHRLGTMELESAFAMHPAVAEAAVVGIPHEIKGQTIYAYIVLKPKYKPSEKLKKELQEYIRNVIGPIATPEYIRFVPELPKTTSGKIMRRILKKIASGDYEDLGDISTLANPEIVKKLISENL